LVEKVPAILIENRVSGGMNIMSNPAEDSNFALFILWKTCGWKQQCHEAFTLLDLRIPHYELEDLLQELQIVELT